ncbi:MAG: carbon-nitrogen hydrolase family protein [Ilumatobacteraceae bacterium]
MRPERAVGVHTVIVSSVLRLAVAQPISALGEIEFNVNEHSSAVRGAEARLVLFPELSLTGYAMGAEPIQWTDNRLAPLVDACAETGSVALAGAPSIDRIGARRISTFRIDELGVSVVYTKVHLGGAEPEHFQPGAGPAVLEIDGWRLGLAICKDNGQPEHAAETAKLGIDAYIAGVCESELDRDVQPRRAVRVVDDHRVWVAYASFAGPTGGGFDDTAGRSAVRGPDGVVRLHLGRRAGLCATTTLGRP